MWGLLVFGSKNAYWLQVQIGCSRAQISSDGFFLLCFRVCWQWGGWYIVIKSQEVSLVSECIFFPLDPGPPCCSNCAYRTRTPFHAHLIFSSIQTRSHANSLEKLSLGIKQLVERSVCSFYLTSPGNSSMLAGFVRRYPCTGKAKSFTTQVINTVIPFGHA